MKCTECGEQMTRKFSTTELIQGTMHAYLKITHDYAVSPDDRSFMVHGINAHSKLQMFDDACCLQEIPLDGGETGITGIPDVLEIEDGWSILWDYKTAGSFKVAKAMGIVVEHEPTGVLYKSGPRKGISRTRKILRQEVSEADRWEWTLQLNWYRILVEARNFHIDEMRIQVIPRDGGTHIAYSRGVFRRVYCFQIPRIEDARIMTYFQKKKADLLYALENGWDDPCTASENWGGIRCQRYCDVAEWCPLGKYLRQEKERRSINMPIEGLEPRMPKSGSIRLGEKRKNSKGVEYPVELDYFKLSPGTPIEEDAVELIDKFHDLYGKEPKEIKVMFPVDDDEQVFPYYYTRWGTVLKCKGDGKTATCFHKDFVEDLEVIGKDASGLPQVRCYGRMGAGEFPETECPHYTSGKCKMSGTLNVLVAGLGMGIWRIHTNSVVSIVEIISGIALIRAFANRINLVPFRLQRRKREGMYDGKKTTHYAVFVEIDGAYENFKKHGTLAPGVGELQIPEYAEAPSEGYDEDRSTLPDPDIPSTDELTYMRAVKLMAEKFDVTIQEFGKFAKEQWGKQEVALPILGEALTNEAKFGDIEATFIDWYNAYVDQQAEDSGW